MSKPASITHLRSTFAASASLEEQFLAFGRLESHHEATWVDVMSGLDGHPMIKDHAVMSLIARFRIATGRPPAKPVGYARDYWMSVLKAESIDPQAIAPPPPPHWCEREVE